MTDKTQTDLEQLRTALYPDGVEEGREGKTDPDGYEKVRRGKTTVRVNLEDLADYLAEHPTARIPEGKPMFCAKCGRRFEGSEFRVCYQAGEFCRYCYRILALAPLSARCIVCKQKIRLDCWRYKLQSITTDGDGDFKRYFVHSDCERALRRSR